MARSRRGYSRYYIILQETRNDYRQDTQKAAAGYARLELRDHKGRILVYVQDIRSLDKEVGVYKVAMITADGEETAVLGDIEVKANGMGQGSWVFDADDVGDTGYPLEEFDSIAVLACPNKARRGSKAPIALCGNFKKDKALTVNDIEAEALGVLLVDEPREVESSSNVPVIEPIPPGEQVVNESASEQPAAAISMGTQEQLAALTEDESTGGSSTEIAEEMEEPLNEVHEKPKKESLEELIEKQRTGFYTDRGPVSFAPPFMSSQSQPIKSDAADEPMPKYSSAQKSSSEVSKYTTFANMINGHIKTFVEQNVVADIFSETIPNSKWCAVKVDQTYVMQWNRYKYDHYLIGLIYEGQQVKYMAYGMPGRFCLGEQPFHGITGYVYWYPAKGQKRQYGDFGYWVAYVDANTGRIIYPF